MQRRTMFSAQCHVKIHGDSVPQFYRQCGLGVTAKKGLLFCILCIAGYFNSVFRTGKAHKPTVFKQLERTRIFGGPIGLKSYPTYFTFTKQQNKLLAF